MVCSMPLKLQEPNIMPSTIETIDTGFYEYIDGKININISSNSGFKKVPVLWLGTERAFQIKNEKSLRDSAGRLKLPLITIERTSMVKDPTFKGSFQANVIVDPNDPRGYRNGQVCIGRRIKQEKTRNFANADYDRDLKTPGAKPNIKGNKKVVYEEIYAPVPTYVAMTYSVTLRSEYQQQMNSMLAPFITRTGQINSFVFKKDNHRYEAFIQQDFTQNNNLANLSEEERMFSSKIDIKVLGYLMGDADGDAAPQIVVKETIVEVKLIRERSIVGDKKPWKSDNEFYRE